jgi:hypothetical protein
MRPGVKGTLMSRLASQIAGVDACHAAISFETIEFVVGTSQISRHLNRTSSVTLTNYLRIARCLGYRCRILLEKAEDRSATASRIAVAAVCQPEAANPLKKDFSAAADRIRRQSA